MGSSTCNLRDIWEQWEIRPKIDQLNYRPCRDEQTLLVPAQWRVKADKAWVVNRGRHRLHSSEKVTGRKFLANPTELLFDQLTAEWQGETETISSITEIAMHPAYQRIIGMGPNAIPYILRQLHTRPNQWFWALRAITGADPIKPEQRGRVKQMMQVWLNWARAEGIEW